MCWTVKKYCQLSHCLFFFPLENMAGVRCSSRLLPNPVNSLEEVHAVSPVQSLRNPCVLQVSQSSAEDLQCLFSVYLKRKGGTGGY